MQNLSEKLRIDYETPSCHPLATLIFTAICSLALSACSSTYKAATQAVDDEYIEVISDQPWEVVEAQLRASGQNYACKELYYGHNAPANRRACFIKKPADLATIAEVRMRDMPMAIALDTGRNILVVGEMFLHTVFAEAVHNRY